MRWVWVVVVIVFAGAVAGCTSGSSPSEGLLTPEAESLLSQLRSAGLSVEPAGEVEQPFFAVTGQVLSSAAEQIQTFTFPSSAAAAAAAGTVSADAGTIGTTSVLWAAPPHFYRSEKLLVLYVGRDARVLSALRAALGPPFAGGQ